jgi:hypothetical protein
MKLFFKQMVESGAKPSNWIYGFSYYEYAYRYSVWYPIPLNWIVRFARELYFWIAYIRIGGFEKKSYDAGYIEGYRRCLRNNHIIDLSLGYEKRDVK